MRKKAISGVGIFKDSDGKGNEFWRVRLGKRFTGGKVIKKAFHKSTTMRNYRSSAKILKEEFGEVEIHDIRKADIEDWISESDWEPRTRKNYIVTLTTVFNYAIDSDYCVANPAERVPRPILDDKPPGILTPAQALALLKAAAGCVPEILPGIAIGLFAGLRRSEVCALDWSELDLTAKTIEVKAAKAKTRQRRIVTVQDNLCEWLNNHHRAKGPVAPDVDVFGERLKHLVKGRKATDDDPGRPAVVQEWPHNALRHSFGSYYYGKSKNENLTAAEMGNSPAVVFKHYRALVKPEDVTAYWAIRPEQLAGTEAPAGKC